VTEPVIKFITVRMDEEEKRIAKVKSLRGHKRSAQVHAAPAQPIAPAPVAQPVAEVEAAPVSA